MTPEQQLNAFGLSSSPRWRRGVVAPPKPLESYESKYLPVIAVAERQIIILDRLPVATQSPSKRASTINKGPHDPRQKGWHWVPPKMVDVAPGVAQARRDSMVNNQALTDQLEKLSRLMGKKGAYDLFNRVLENQKFELNGPGRWEYIHSDIPSEKDYDRAAAFSKAKGFNQRDFHNNEED